MSFSDYWEEKIMNHIFGKGSYTPETIYVGLSKADPGEDGSGLDEPSGGSYARVTTAAGDWNAWSSGLIDNANVITFPTPTGDWGTLTHVFIANAVSGGSVMGSALLPIAQSVGSGSIAPEFAIGAFITTLD